MTYIFNGLETDQFLTKYWQRRPLLVRDAFDLPDIIDADELAGLAMEPDVESRLITTDATWDKWTIKHGPLDDKDFDSLPESHWTLLVQAVDHWVPDIRALLKSFHFLPQWRIDDVMVSFAPVGGGVGPHYDQYDVFLIQLSGEREWKVGQVCEDNSETIPDVPVKLLANFEEQARWVLKPGDVLYVPPAIAHWGTAVTDSLTLSVGFRAPATSEIVAELGHFLAEQMSDFNRYSDAGVENRQQSPHEIYESDISRLTSMISKLANDRELIGKWFGQHMTEPKYEDQTNHIEDITEQELLGHWKQQPLYRNTSSRMAFSGGSLFADGQTFTTMLPNETLHKLCDNDELGLALFDDPSPQLLELVLELTNNGVFVFEN